MRAAARFGRGKLLSKLTRETRKGRGLEEAGSALSSQGWVGLSHSQSTIQVLLAHLIFLFYCSSNQQADSENVILGQPDTNIS